MKILFVSDAIYPHHIGGKEKRIFEFSTRLAKLGHDVHIFTMKWWAGPMVIQEKGVFLHGICPLKKMYINGKRSIWQGMYFALKMFWPLCKEKFDVMDVDHMVYFIVYVSRLVTWIKRKKLILTWHEVWGKEYWLSYLGKKGYFGYLLEKYAAKIADNIISVSNFTTQKIIVNYSINTDKIITISNGVDLIKINNIPDQYKEYDLIYAGRLIKHKNVDFLIQVVNILKEKITNIKCLIIGNGPEKNNIINLINKLNLQDSIMLIDKVTTDDEYIKLNKAAKLFISLSVREGLGMAVLEANACGLPAVIVNHKDNAATSIIKDDINGIVCPLDIEIISQRIISLINNQELLNKMQIEAVQNSRKFDWQLLALNLQKYYQMNL